MASDGDLAARARAWLHRLHAEFCDVHEPWAHGTVVRASRYPNYWDFNAVRVEEDPGMSAEELAAFADEALGDLAHRRVDFEEADAAEPLRERFEALGWKTQRLVWMHHESGPPPQPDIPVEDVPDEAVLDLRLAWHQEDFPGQDFHEAEAREVARRRGARILAARDSGVPVAFAQLEGDEDSAEIAQVYVRSDHRGRGLGTAITCAAIHAAGGGRDLWIVADDEARPKQLYERLGFRPAWTAIETLRLP